jgi:hypothetical protein
MSAVWAGLLQPGRRFRAHRHLADGSLPTVRRRTQARILPGAAIAGFTVTKLQRAILQDADNKVRALQTTLERAGCNGWAIEARLVAEATTAVLHAEEETE